MKHLIRIVVVLAVVVNVPAQTRDGAGIVWGKDFAFSIHAPRGWVLDNSSGRKQGLHAVFYRDGETWQKASVIMYANTASKSVKGQQTLEELMAYDAEQFRKRAPALSVKALADIKTKSRTATVRKFEGDQHGNFEAVAYLDEKTTIVMLVLSARAKDEFEKAYPAFEQLVRSYEFLSTDVKF